MFRWRHFFQSKVFREIYNNWFVPILLHAGGRFPTPSTAQCVQMSWLGHTKSSRFSTWTHQVKYKGNMEVEIGGSEFNPYYHILWLRWSKSNQYRAYFYDCVIFSDLTWRWVQVQLVTARFYDLVGPSLTLDILNFDRGQGSSKSRAAMGSVCLPVQFKRSYKKVDIANSVATILQRPQSKWHSASDESFKDLSDTEQNYDLVGPSPTLDILNFDRGQGSSKSRAAMGSVCLPVQFKRSYKKVDIANSIASILQRPHSKWHSASDESFKDLSDREQSKLS